MKTCKVKNCKRKHYATDLCGLHYHRMFRLGSVNLPKIKTYWKKHGMRNTSEYWTWTSMKQRCFNPNDKGYKNYGKRGITVVKHWKDSFENFIDDMGKRPSNKHSLERKNNSKNYSPSNCIWATAADQSRNRRSTKLTLKDARKIRKLYFENKYTRTKIAESFGISPRNVDFIVKNLTWKDGQS